MEHMLYTGFARVDVTPEEYRTLAGNGNDMYRKCDLILDRITGTCIALRDGAGETVLLCTVDFLNAVKPTVVEGARRAIREATGVAEDHISVSVTHTHAGPSIYDWEDDATLAYFAFYRKQMAKAAREAIEDLKPSQIYIGQRLIPGMTFVRHYIGNDGTYFGPNFGSGKSGAKAHADVPDDQLQVMRFAREGGRDMVLVNWQSHCTITNGTKDEKGRTVTATWMSADYPAAMRNHLEGSLGCYSAFFQGACGNLVPSSRIEGEALAPYEKEPYGRKLAEFIMECLQENMRPANAGPIQVIRHDFVGVVNHTEDHRVPDAQAVRASYYDMEEPADRRALLQKYGFNSVLHANSVVNRSNSPATINMELMAISMGDIAFATAPIEMFNSHGRHIKNNSPFQLTFMLAYSNGSHSYIPDEKAFQYDCYEKNTCLFLPGTGEEIAKTHVALLNQLKESN